MVKCSSPASIFLMPAVQLLSTPFKVTVAGVIILGAPAGIKGLQNGRPVAVSTMVFSVHPEGF